MLEVRDLVRKYGETTAVAGISFEVAPREVVGFLGPNGAGKTTTLRVLAGFLEPTSGSARVLGRDIVDAGLECRRAIGYLPENNPLYEEMEVVEYLDWTASVRGLSGPDRRRAIRTAVARCGLGPVVGWDIGRLSKGYRQRVGLAAAIVHDPPILLLDEPTSGLDPNQAAEVRSLIAELRAEKTVLLSSHILSEVRASCDRVVILHQGRVAAQGSPAELESSASGEQKVQLVLAAGPDPEAVLSELARVDGVASVSHEDRAGEHLYSCAVAPGGGDPRARVFALAASRRWPVLELRREAASLEEVFRSLTR